MEIFKIVIGIMCGFTLGGLYQVMTHSPSGDYRPIGVVGIIAAVILAQVIFAYATIGFKGGKDSTDAVTGMSSGLTIYVDHKTGIQYLGTMLGGLTPRLDIDGLPMTEGEDR